MKRVAILALEQTMASTVTGPMDIFSLAGVLWNQIRGQELTPYFDVQIVTANGRKITTLNNTIIQPHCGIKALDVIDLIIISVADVGMLSQQRKQLVPWLIDQYQRGATIASVCTGAFLLAETGLLNNRKATTHWGFTELFTKMYPQVILKPEQMIIDEGRLLTGGGAHSYFDLCLYLIERYCGYDVAVQCSKSLLLDTGRRSQTPYAIFEFQRQHGDVEILKAQNLIEQQFDQELLLSDIADRVGMSLRNFKRRFKKATGDAPLSYLQRFRVEAAKRALERERKSIDEISYQVGYQDTTHFRTIFKKFTGMTPNDYRKRIGVNNLSTVE